MTIVLTLASLLSSELIAEEVVIDIVSSNRHIEDFIDKDVEGFRIEKRTLSGGRQQGVELLIIDNGKLHITLIPTRGLSVLKVVSGDVELGWNSPVKEVVHPSFVDLESRGGLGWLEGFNEWMVRCGLEFAGHPGLDKFKTNTGDDAEMTLTLHGRIGNIPASECQVRIDSASKRLTVTGAVHERMFYGPKLELKTSLSTSVNSDSFQVSDTVTNHGATSQEFQLIYHANYGAPLLGKDARVYAAAEWLAPMNAHAAGTIENWHTYSAPTTGFVEEVYLLKPKGDTTTNRQTTAVLVNPARDVATSLKWSVLELDYLTVWKNTAALEDGYVTGIEPATGFPYNRSVERRAGRLKKLDKGESRTFSIEFGIHTGEEAVQKAIGSVKTLQGDNPPVLKREPLENIN